MYTTRIHGVPVSCRSLDGLFVILRRIRSFHRAEAA